MKMPVRNDMQYMRTPFHWDGHIGTANQEKGPNIENSKLPDYYCNMPSLNSIGK